MGKSFSDLVAMILGRAHAKQFEREQRVQVTITMPLDLAAVFYAAIAGALLAKQDKPGWREAAEDLDTRFGQLAKAGRLEPLVNTLHQLQQSALQVITDDADAPKQIVLDLGALVVQNEKGEA